MNTVARWIGLFLVGVIGLLLLSGTVFYFLAEARLSQVYEIEPKPIPIPEDVPSQEEVGFPLIAIAACQDCHAEDLGGKIMQDDPLSARLVGTNLTSGEGGIGGEYSDPDWVRALRHGVDPEGEPLLVIPADEFGHLSDRDLGLLIGYLKQLPPVDRDLPDSTLGPLSRVMLVLNMLPPWMIPAETIDHEGDTLEESPPSGTIEYGEYLAALCTLCHGQNFAGSPSPVDERFLLSPMNLTPGGVLVTWSEEDFIHTLRTGVAPDGYELDPEEMPWRSIGRATDEQLSGLWSFLKSVPPVQTDHR